jgi:hydrogenase/urease accessory protein HupE
MTRVLLLLVCAGALLAPVAQAHEVRPGYLEVRQTAPDTYELLFKLPARGEEFRLALYLNLPEGTQDAVAPRALFTGGAYVERRTIRRDGGLNGQSIAIDGLSSTFTDVLVRVQNLAGVTHTERLTPTKASFVIKAAPGTGEVATTYLWLGIEHILGGVDHLLFVLGLLLLVKGGRRIFFTITAFTIAHSITLAAATLGAIRVPEAPLNATIALSILFVGLEVVRAGRGETSLTIRYPWCVAFAFGLLHGCGFASGLSEAGLPQHAIPLALLFFNLGVEAGQLAFVALFFALRWALRTLEVPAPPWATPIPAYVVGVAGAYWTIVQLQPLILAFAQRLA